MAKDLRYFIEQVEQRHPQYFQRIKREVSPKWEVSSLQKRLETEDRLPVLLFENIAGHHGMRMVTNLFASKQHLALALDTTPEKVVEKFTEAQIHPIEPMMVESGPVKEVILKGEEADLRTLPQYLQPIALSPRAG